MRQISGVPIVALLIIFAVLGLALDCAQDQEEHNSPELINFGDAITTEKETKSSFFPLTGEPLTDRLREATVGYRSIDTVYFAASTLYAWISSPKRKWAQERADFPQVSRRDFAWHMCLEPFFDTNSQAFHLFKKADVYKVVVFINRMERDQYGRLLSQSRYPVAWWVMTRQTYEKINWEYIYGEIVGITMCTDYGSTRSKLLPLFDAYWIDERYLR